MIGAASHLTPTEQEIADRRRAFRAKIAARAVPDPGICLKAAQVEPELPPEESEQQWCLRQARIYQPLKDMWFSITGEVPAKRMSIADIQTITASHYGISRTSLNSQDRMACIVVPRQIAMYLAKVLTFRTLPEIGRRFGNRDHTTVLHAVRKITDRIAKDKDFAAQVETVRQKIVGNA